MTMSIFMKSFLLILCCLIAVIVVPVHASNDLTAKIVVSAPTPDQVTPNITEFTRLLRGAIAERNWTEALTISKTAATAYPENPDFVCNGGYALRKLGRFEESVDQVSKGCILDPKPIRFANRGYGYLAMGNLTAALADADAGIALNASYPTSYAIRALALQGMGNTSEALIAINHAVELEPKNAHYWHVRGKILADAGDCEAARASLERSIALDPNYDLPWPGFSNASTSLAALDSTWMPATKQNITGSSASGMGSPGTTPTKSPLGAVAVAGLAIALVIGRSRR
jgi:tetratricopeptide (TPR) repeat protein